MYGQIGGVTDDPHLYKEGVDGVIRRCVPEHEQEQSYASVIPRLMEDTMLEIELHIRYCNPVLLAYSLEGCP